MRCLRAFPVIFAFLAILCPVRACLAADQVEVVVEGIADDALENVRAALALPHGLVRDGKVDRLWLDRFAGQADEKIKAALEPYGYYNAQDTITVEEPEKGDFRVRVVVRPGNQVRIEELRVSLQGPGATAEQLRDLVAAFPLEKGGILLQQEYEQAKKALKSTAVSLGYLDADFPTHEIRINKGASSARVELVLDTGTRYSFDGIRIEGEPDYPDDFLRRNLAFRSGDIFSYAKLGETQLNFSNSEHFKKVIITPEKQKAEGFKVPVLVQLTPAPRWSLRPGIGYGTDTGARLSLRYRDLNMFHLGHEFYSNLFIAENLQGLATGYVWPDSKDIKSSTTLQLNLQRDDVTTYVSRLIAVELDRNRSLGHGDLGTAYIKLQQEDFTIGAQNSGSRLVLPGLRLNGDHYDNLIRPAHGYHYGFDLRGTHSFLGSDTELLQLVSDGSCLFALPWRLSLHARATAGITLLSDPLKDLPPSLRFFAGGDQSVRGYTYKSIGPRDATGQVVGGKHLLTGSVELERALFKNWGVSAFYDAGNAFNSFVKVSMFQGAGIGLHYYTPIGALNLFLARQIGIANPGYHIHFTVGFEL